MRVKQLNPPMNIGTKVPSKAGEKQLPHQSNLTGNEQLFEELSKEIAYALEAILDASKTLLLNAFLGSGRGTVGKCTGPKWSKMVQTTILVKMPLFRTGF